MSAQLAQSVWRVFLVLKSEFKPCFGSCFFKTNFYFFLKYFRVFYLPIVFFNHSRVKIKI